MHVFGKFNFGSKVTILQRLYPMYSGRFRLFLKSCHLSNISYFFGAVFAQNNSNMIVESLFAFFFLEFYFGTQSDHFAKAIAFV